MENKKSNTDLIQSAQLMKLFEDELKDIYWAEKALTKAIPKMIKNATSNELIEVLTTHLDETHEQVERLAKVFASIEKKPVAKTCEAMEGLLKEAESITESCETGAMCDAGIVLAVQKIEHYEIASYGTLCAFATTLGLTQAIPLLEATLSEEKATNEDLSEIAQSINIEVSEEDKHLMT